MNEEFIQFVWKNGLFNNKNLFTTDGDKIEIIKTGVKNTNAGPDFFDARIKIGSTLWAGNVEVHKGVSDWRRHQHHLDDNYKNVILHVVTENDIPDNINNDIPVFILKWDPSVEKNYNSLVVKNNAGLCDDYLKHTDVFRIKFFLNRIIADRIKQKTDILTDVLERTKGDWSESFYQILARSFGFKENGLPFEMLARSLPQKILNKHHYSLSQTEALIFGQSGLLGDELFADEYYIELRNEYRYLAQKYGLKPIAGHIWKFMRMRPMNFPSVRLAQFAVLLHRSQGIFSAVIETENINRLEELFMVKASGYWDLHYNFNKLSKEIPKSLGKQAFRSILINVVVPFLFVYGEYNNILSLKDRALNILEELPPEDNKIVRAWRSKGIEASNALESQALLSLKDNYCEPKRCLECNIGQKIILDEKV
jgi:hypothetical protein